MLINLHLNDNRVQKYNMTKHLADIAGVYLEN